MRLKEQYFQDQAAIAKLQGDILQVIPEEAYYHVVIIALSKCLERFCASWVDTETEERWTYKQDSET